MNPAQDRGYWRRWGAVVRAHGLNQLPKEQQEAERRQLTLDATKGRTSSHRDLVNNAEITRLFRLLEFKARPLDLAAALPVANPELEEEADEQRRVVFALRAKGLGDREIQRIAQPFCRKHHVASWQLLPSAVLKQMAAWKQFRPEEIARRRQTPALLIATRPDENVVEYVLYPTSHPKPRPLCKGPF